MARVDGDLRSTAARFAPSRFFQARGIALVLVYIVLASFVPSLLQAGAPPLQRTQAELAPGTRWATQYTVVQAPVQRPIVVVVAGIHGDEAAGPIAARRLLTWPLRKGTLVVIPEANQPALAIGKRLAPRTRYHNLNRNFPRTSSEAPRGTMARALWDAIQATRPDWVVDLHEGFDFNAANPKSVGSSLLFFPTPALEWQAARMVQEVNQDITLEPRKFTLLRRTARGSLVRAVTKRLGIPSMIVETTKNGQPLETRVQQQLKIIGRLLIDQGMVAPDALDAGLVQAGQAPAPAAAEGGESDATTTATDAAQD